jgi:Tfp pilus assembly protein PilN
MAAINFVKQLRERRKNPANVDLQFEGDGEGDSSSGDIGAKLKKFAATSGVKPEPRDIVFLLLALVVFAAGQMKDQILEDYFRKDKMAEVERQLSDLAQKIAEQEQKLASFANFQGEIEAYDRQVADYNEKLRLIKSVRIGRNSCVRMVDYIVKKLPAGVWLEQLDMNLSGAIGPEAGSKFGLVTVQGFSETHQEVSAFLGELEGTSFFPEWQLDQATSSTAAPPVEGPGAAAANSAPLNSKKFNIKADVVQL